MNLIEELSKYGITERGNTALIEDDCGGGSAMYCELEEGKWLEVSMQPKNYPAWFITIQNKSKSEIRTHIEENFGNYYLQKNNIGVNAVDNQPVSIDYVMEAVRDRLYIYRDNNKDMDTVTTIHNFLDGKEWTLDIADIENLRQEYDN